MLSEHLSYKQKQIHILAYENTLIKVHYDDLRTSEDISKAPVYHRYLPQKTY